MSIEERVRETFSESGAPLTDAIFLLAQSLDELRTLIQKAISDHGLAHHDPINDRRDALEKRLDFLESRVARMETLGERIGKLEKRLTDMGREVDGLSARLGKEIGEVKAAITEQGFEQTDALEELRERVGKLELRPQGWGTWYPSEWTVPIMGNAELGAEQEIPKPEPPEPKPEPAEPKPHEDPHDWGIDSYRCLRCGANRDDAPDQPCRPAAPKPASTLVACVSKAIYHGEGAPAEDAIRAVAEWLDNAGSGYAATILRVGLEP